DAVDDIYSGHHYAGSVAEASAKAVKAGTDLDCGKSYSTLVEAVKKGYISEEEINRSVERLFVARIRLGMFDPPERVPFSKMGIEQKFGNQTKIRFALGSTYVQSGMALLPENVLRPPDSPGARLGLKAEYFDNGNFSGAPVLTRVEPRGYFTWDMQNPAVVKSVPRQNFSVRWTGTIQVNQGGDYQFGVVRAECHSCGRTDSARIYIDDQFLIADTRRPNESMSPQQ